MLHQGSMGPSGSKARIGLLIALIFIAVAIPVIGLLVFQSPEPPNAGILVRGQYFIFKLLWCEFLLVVLSVGCIKGLGGELLRQRQQTGGGVVVQFAIIAKACLWSLLILGVSVFLSEKYQQWILIAQIIVVIAAITLVATVTAARVLQNDGIVPPPDGVKRPDQLVAQIGALENIIFSKHSVSAASIKTIKERINYSLPRVGKIATSVIYLDIVKDIESLCDAIESKNGSAAINELCGKVDQKITLLIAEITGN
jgi:hypothetical protein